jgi:hypothetical protein
VADAQGTLRPCLRAWYAAIDALNDAGGNAELLMVVRDDDHALAEARRWEALRGSVVIVCDGQTEGEALNIGIAHARHGVICVADAADLVPPNVLKSGLNVLENSDAQTIVHPGQVVRFGRSWSVHIISDMIEAPIGAGDALFTDPWPQVALAERTVFAAVPFRSLPVDEGLGPTSWTWNIDSAVAGFTHRADRAVRQFRRHRFPPNGAEAPVMLLPRVDFATLQTRLGPSKQRAAADPAEPTRRNLMHRAREVVRWARSYVPMTMRRRRDSEAPTHPDIAPSDLALAAIEPAISWAVEHLADLPHWEGRDDGYGALLLDVAPRLGSGGAVVAVPWLGVGGGDLAAVEYTRAFATFDRFAANVRLLTTDQPDKTLPEHVPGDIRLVQMPHGLSALTPDWQQRLVAQLILLTGPELLLGANCHHLTDAMNLAGPQICGATRVHLTLFGFDQRAGGLPSSPLTDEGLRRAINGVAGVVTDNSLTARRAEEVLALDPSRILTIPLPALEPRQPASHRSHAWLDDLAPSDPIRLLWPHRLDAEKRPDVLPAILKALSVKGIRATIDVWGSAVFTQDSSALLEALAVAGIRYRGPYSGGLSSLPVGDYHGMLITSVAEGTPVALIEALLLGLPVVSTAVGGVPDLIVDGETGILVPSADDLDGFVRAIEALRVRSTRRLLITNGFTKADSRHSRRAFLSSIERDLLG